MAKGVAKMAKAVERLKAVGLAPADEDARPHPLGAPPRPLDRGQPAPAHRRGERRGHGHQRQAWSASHGDAVREARRGGRQRPADAAPARRQLPRPSSKPSPTTSRCTAERVARSPARPASASPARCPTGRPASSRSTTPTPARSARAASANPSSSATRPRSSTTRTAWSSTTTSRSATHPTPRCSNRRSNASAQRTGACPTRSPPTVAMARRAVEDDSASSACARGAADQGQTERRPTSNREPPASKTLVRWRTGCEGRISCLKRDFGWSRTRIDGIEGARTWCGHGVFNHNLVKIAGLMSTNP